MAERRPVVGYVVRKFPVLSETFILNEILALEARGLDVHIFALAPTRDPRFHEGVSRLRGEVHYLPGPLEMKDLLRYARRYAARDRKHYRKSLLRVLSKRNAALLWRFLQASWVADRARKAGVRHFHAHFANRSATVAQQAARLLGVPFSFTAHAFDIYRGADHRVIAQKMSEARFTATVSDFNVTFLESLANGSRPRIELVRNGIDMARFAPARRIPDGQFRILAVARLVEKKGIAVLVEACRMLRDRGLEFHCEIIGKGALRGPLERMIREWKLADRVALVGALAQQQIVAHYHQADVLALPCIVGKDGNRDGLPVSIVEALACGVPVISTPVTGIPEVVRDGVNGLIVPENDAGALAYAIERLMSDPELHHRLCSAARHSVEEMFDQETTAERLHLLLRESVA